MTSGRLADPWPAVTDALFTGGVQTGNPGRFPDSVAAGSRVRRGDALAGCVPGSGDREGVGADPQLLCRVGTESPSRGSIVKVAQV